MTNQPRRRWAAEDKQRILAEARQPGHGIRETCRRHRIATSQFYDWERRASQASLEGLHDRRRSRTAASRAVELQAEIERLRTMVVELSAENLRFKKRRQL